MIKIECRCINCLLPSYHLIELEDLDTNNLPSCPHCGSKNIIVESIVRNDV